MLLSAVSVLVVAQSSSEIPEGLMNNPVYVSCYATANEITVVWDLRIAWRKPTVTLSPSRLKAGVDVLSRTSLIHTFLPARQARSTSQFLWHTTVVLRRYEGPTHDSRLTWWTAGRGTCLALPLNRRQSFVSLSVGCNWNEVCVMCAFF